MLRKFVAAVRDQQKREGLSQTKLAKKIGVSDAGLSRIYAGKRKPSVEFICGVIRAWPDLFEILRQSLLEDLR